jgi:signal transduction histidine kinase
MEASPPTARPDPTGATQIAATARRWFIAYARWLDSISWKRFFVLAILALIIAGMLSSLPPFSTEWGRGATVIETTRGPVKKGTDTPASKERSRSYEINIDKNGVHITPVKPPSTVASSPAAPGALPKLPAPPAPPAIPEERDDEAPAASSASAAVGTETLPGVHIPLPPGADADEIRQAIEDAQKEIVDALGETHTRVRTLPGFTIGEHLPPLTFLLIVLSGVIKIMAAGRFKAEATAVSATEMAEAEALKRQVVEARMAAMQAQVEPHFLFNTLASIDHLIETDPARASQMQKNLIALLRASMPSMREANPQAQNLGREMAVIRPYLEILKVRMEDRLQTEVNVPDGLLSAEFPSMMIQSLVENAIKHGLEPKAEGGKLTVKAEIVHGKLAVTVADTGLGFGKAATAGTGTGLANIRERLKLLYGNRASMVVTENVPSGTIVTLTVPYQARTPQGEAA